MFNTGPKDPAMLAKLQEALGWLNGYLDGHNYVSGCSITIADHALVASVSSFDAAGN